MCSEGYEINIIILDEKSGILIQIQIFWLSDISEKC